MSGRKQHYIPQVLLKGFSANPNAKAPPIYVYSRARGVYKTNTKDTAAEREFYSPINAGGASLDDDISVYENTLARQLDTLKQYGQGPTEGTLAASVIVHLTLRNDHTRKTIAEAGEQLLGAVVEMFSDVSVIRGMMGFDKPLEESLLKQEIRKALLGKYPGLSTGQVNALEARVSEIAAVGFGQIFEQQRPNIMAAAQALLASVGEMTKEGHVKALTNSVAPEKRISSLSEMRWTIVQGKFILPDCVAVAIGADGHPLPYILTDIDKLHSVFMPLNRSLGLYGTLGDDQPLSLDPINRANASCSADFFIAASEEPELKPLVELIGTRTSELVEQMTSEAIKTHKSEHQLN